MAKPSITATQRAQFDLEAVLATEEGRRVLWRIITSCGVWARTSGINGQMQVEEGMRRVGIQLMEDIEAVSPNLVPVMMQDAYNAELAHGK